MVVGQKYNRKDKIIKQRPFNPCFALHENEAKIKLFTEEQLRSASFLWFCFRSRFICISLSLELTIIPRARVGYEMIDSQRGA